VFRQALDPQEFQHLKIMAVKLQDIKATNWQLSVNGIGQIAEGIEDVRQCIGIILTSTKGSDPMRPQFGSNIWQFMDDQITTAITDMSAEIVDCISKWEPRVIIKKLTYEATGSRIDYNLSVQLLESGQITEILFYIDRQKQIEPLKMGHAFSNGFDFGFS